MNSTAALPHIYPFLFVDRILDLDEGKRVVCAKNITSDEDFFDACPGESPAVPQTLLVEAMAQTSGLLISPDINKHEKLAFLAAIKNAVFKRPVTPGEQLKITSIFIKSFYPLYIFSASITSGDNLIAEAEIILSRADTENE